MADLALPSQFGVERAGTLTASGELSIDDVKTNTGHSQQDVDSRAEMSKSETIAEWQSRNNIDTSKQIRLVKLAHMRYQHADMEKEIRFLRDFGMQIVKREDNDRIWFRGYGTDPYVYYAQKGAEKKFLGGTFVVESFQDLEKATKLPGASEIEELEDAPGGGHFITVFDPEGFPVNLIYGQEPAPRGDLPEKIVQNFEVDKPRVRKFHRFTPGAAAVHKLGHYGYTVQKFEEQLSFYTRNFNLVPSDFLTAPVEGHVKDVATFLHIDRGDDPVDHHTLFMATNDTTHVHHASFEVHDFDTQHLGHQWLAKQGYQSVWGLGRHILGSQIFDYWWDTSHNMIEHYADGDLVNRLTPIGWMDAGDESLAVWGPEVPKSFLN